MRYTYRVIKNSYS